MSQSHAVTAQNIYRRAFQMLGQDPLATFKVYSPLLLLVVVLSLCALLYLSLTTLQNSGLTVALGFLVAIASFWVFCTCCVNFHRYIVLGEQPSWLILKNSQLGFGYFLRAVVLALIFVGTMLPALLGFLFGSGVAVILFVVFTVLGSYLLMRLSPALAALAVGDQIGFKEAFARTAPYNRTFIALTFIYFFIQFIYNLIERFDPTIIFTLTIGVFLGVLHIAVITACYEIISDKRASTEA